MIALYAVSRRCGRSAGQLDDLLEEVRQSCATAARASRSSASIARHRRHCSGTSGARHRRDLLRVHRRRPDLPLPDIVSAARIAVDGATPWQPHSPRSAGRCALARPTDLALMPYTSGTTARRQAACNASQRDHTLIAARNSATPRGQRGARPLPMFHVTGMQTASTRRSAGLHRHRAARWDKRCAAMLIEALSHHDVDGDPTMLFDSSTSRTSSYDLTRCTASPAAGRNAEAVAEASARSGASTHRGLWTVETMAPTHLNPRHRPKPQCLACRCSAPHRSWSIL